LKKKRALRGISLKEKAHVPNQETQRFEKRRREGEGAGKLLGLEMRPVVCMAVNHQPM